MAAQGSTQRNPSKVAGTFQHVPPVASGTMSGPSTSLQVSRPASIPLANLSYALDSHKGKPSTWDEVHLIQKALKASVRSFVRIHSRNPPSFPGSSWLSFAEQLELLQRESDRCWGADRRTGAPPKLAGFAKGKGRKPMDNKAGSHTTKNKPPYGTGQWHQNKFSKKMYKGAQKILSAADVRRAKSKAQAVHGRGQQDASENIMDILDTIVARDPERYLAWLLTVGYFYFTTNDHNPLKCPWEEWCRWGAPKSFHSCCKPVPFLMRPSLGYGAIDRGRYGPPGNRPTITLEEAMKGDRRTKRFQGTVDGVEMSSVPEYYMIGGEATSRAASAHYNMIRGKDVWLSEPAKLIGEGCNDPSRQREAEVEASFGC